MSIAEKVLILDFGSQYTQLIARRIRQQRVYCEIHPYSMSARAVAAFAPRAIVLSGGPASVHEPGAPDIDPAILDMPLPILGVCYGVQLLAHRLGGRVVSSPDREYGRASVRLAADQPDIGRKLWLGIDPHEALDVWMSHGDSIKELPREFCAVAHTESTPYAAIAHRSRPIVGLQFHPEVSHTLHGEEILANFLFEIAGLKPAWTMESFLDEQRHRLREVVGPNERVLCALSGGVDSSVVAALCAQALGDRLVCIFVDNGLLRQGEVDRVRSIFEHAFHVPLIVADARQHFLEALRGVTDPERKRKIIGKAFIEVFEAEARRIENAHYLAQGTLYPDVIESVSFRGPSATIKSHHNVGGLPERMNLKLIEPLRELFKDEVRVLGMELGLPDHVCYRQPFPGPGLAVRIIGEVTAERLEVLRQADHVVQEEIVAAGYDRKVWQAFAVLLPVRSVGVMGDARTYEDTICIRAVDSVDGMTADWSRLPHELVAAMANRIINEVRGVNRVVYDVSSKPPATIEWE